MTSACAEEVYRVPRRPNRLTRSVRRDASVAEASRQSFRPCRNRVHGPREENGDLTGRRESFVEYADGRHSVGFDKR